MRAKHAYLAVACAAFSALVVIASASKAQAGYPMISGIPNQYIYMNSETGVIPFNVYDDKTPPADLELSYRSDTPSLVPEDDGNIILGGAGSSRTVKVIPEEGRTGRATITIIVEDDDGETNQDSFEVSVSRAPRIP